MSCRPPLGVEVEAECYQRLKNYAKDEYGDVQGSTGRMLEEALREYLDEDRYAALEQQIDELLEGLRRTNSDDRAKKTDVEYRREDATVAGARIYRPVKTRLREIADEWETTMGKIATSAIRTFLDNDRSERLERKVRQFESLLEDGSPRKSDLSAKERRLGTICAELGEPPFSLEDFDQAVRAANGIDAGEHAREEYLPKVLERLGCYPWQGENADVFVGPQRFRQNWGSPDTADPIYLPNDAMSEEDIETALLAEGIRRASSSGNRYLFDVKAAREYLGGFRNPTVKKTMRGLASQWSGIAWKDDKSTGIAVNLDEFPTSEQAGRQQLAIAGLLGSSEVGQGEDGLSEGWEARVATSLDLDGLLETFESVEEIPDKILRAKIAREWAGEISLNGQEETPERALDAVENRDLKRLREELKGHCTTIDAGYEEGAAAATMGD
jgi:hypothetical protein